MSIDAGREVVWRSCSHSAVEPWVGSDGGEKPAHGTDGSGQLVLVFRIQLRLSLVEAG